MYIVSVEVKLETCHMKVQNKLLPVSLVVTRRPQGDVPATWKSMDMQDMGLCEQESDRSLALGDVEEKHICYR